MTEDVSPAAPSTRIPRVYSIPAGVPFLQTLLDELLSGRFGHVGRDDPLALADVTILLPTRRAARTLRQLLIENHPKRAALMPKVRPIGDVDEDEHLLAAPEVDPSEALTLPPAISRLERSLALTGLVMAWGAAARAEVGGTAEVQAILPASAADAFKLSRDLARLIDDMGTAGVAWSSLTALAPDEYAGYWQLTLDFLKVASRQWPAFLEEVGRVDPVTRRDQLIRDQARRLASSPPTGLVIAAGSTGSIPATAELLKTIASLSNGAVVLPGLDTRTDDVGWSAIGRDDGHGAAAPSHPQFGLKRLISEIGIDRADVALLGVSPHHLAARTEVVSEAMRPAETTERWAVAKPLDEETLRGVALIEARNEEDEALAIGVALREALETPGRVAALVTPDRTLAKRVAVALRRWNIRVDDSAGQPLAASMPGVLVRLIADAALTGDASAVAALGKHPLARFGSSRLRCRRAAEALEVALLRGPSGNGPIATLDQRLANMRLGTEMRTERFTPRARRRLAKAEWNAAEALGKRYAKVLGPLEDASIGGEINVAEATGLVANALEAAADDGSGNGGTVWEDRAGESLAGLLSGLMSAERLSLPPHEFPAFLAAAMADISVTPEMGTDPRIHIWGTLEARLQPTDLLIVGGLDEGTWPAESRTDPWLSRQMRNEIGLPPPERRIGQAAHDFTSAMGAEEVVLSRAERRAGTPTVESRWLQRLRALVGPAFDTVAARGERYLRLARKLDRVLPADVKPIDRPAPSPKVEARPRELSVTSIEQLIRDPYAVYARRILQLEPLEPIGQRADPRLRGSLIHEAFADFTRTWSGPFDNGARERLIGLWRRHFEQIAAYPEVHAVWLLKADRIADWFVDWEAGRDSEIESRHAEIAGTLDFEIGARGTFRLTGRADRIDILKDGRAAIYDYKTGALATAKQVLVFQPQLALEGAILRAGHFDERFDGRSLAELAWVGLGQIGKNNPLRAAVPEDMTPDEVSAEAFRRVRELIIAYESPEKGYVSQARPMFERRIPGDYDHLARVAEWRFAPGTVE